MAQSFMIRPTPYNTQLHFKYSMTLMLLHHTSQATEHYEQQIIKNINMNNICYRVKINKSCATGLIECGFCFGWYYSSIQVILGLAYLSYLVMSFFSFKNLQKSFSEKQTNYITFFPVIRTQACCIFSSDMVTLRLFSFQTKAYHHTANNQIVEFIKLTIGTLRDTNHEGSSNNCHNIVLGHLKCIEYNIMTIITFVTFYTLTSTMFATSQSITLHLTILVIL